MRVDSMVPGDWDRVRAIYEQGIATGDATFETEPPSWEEWDRDHLCAPRLAVRDGGALLGWAVANGWAASGGSGAT